MRPATSPRVLISDVEVGRRGSKRHGTSPRVLVTDLEVEGRGQNNPRLPSKSSKGSKGSSGRDLDDEYSSRTVSKTSTSSKFTSSIPSSRTLSKISTDDGSVTEIDAETPERLHEHDDFFLESLEDMSATVIHMARSGNKEAAMQYASVYTQKALELHGSSHSSYINGLATVAALCDVKGKSEKAQEILTVAEMLQEDREATIIAKDHAIDRGSLTVSDATLLMKKMNELENMDEQKIIELTNSDDQKEEEEEIFDDDDWSDIDETDIIAALSEEIQELLGAGQADAAAKLLTRSEKELRAREDLKLSNVAEASLHTLWAAIMESIGENDKAQLLYREAATLIENEDYTSENSDSEHLFETSSEESEVDESDKEKTNTQTSWMSAENSTKSKEDNAKKKESNVGAENSTKSKENNVEIKESKENENKNTSKIKTEGAKNAKESKKNEVKEKKSGDVADGLESLQRRAAALTKGVLLEKRVPADEDANNLLFSPRKKDEPTTHPDVSTLSGLEALQCHIQTMVFPTSSEDPESSVPTRAETSKETTLPDDEIIETKEATESTGAQPSEAQSSQTPETTEDQRKNIKTPSPPPEANQHTTTRLSPGGRRLVRPKPTALSSIESPIHIPGPRLLEDFDNSSCSSMPSLMSPSAARSPRSPKRKHPELTPKLQPLSASPVASPKRNEVPPTPPTNRIRIGGGFHGNSTVSSPRKSNNVKLKKLPQPAALPVEIQEKLGTENIPPALEKKEDVPVPIEKEIDDGVSDDDDGSADDEDDADFQSRHAQMVGEALHFRDHLTFGPLAPAIVQADMCVARGKLSEAGDKLEALLDALASTKTPLRDTDVHIATFERFSEVLHLNKEYDAALDALIAADEILEERVEKADPDDPESKVYHVERAGLHDMMGTVCMSACSFGNAQEYFEKAVNFFSMEEERLGRLKELENKIAQKTKTPPIKGDEENKNDETGFDAMAVLKFRQCLSNLAQCYVKQGKFEKAAEVYQIAMEDEIEDMQRIEKDISGQRAEVKA